jgi:predicted O-linked N-acetylglucosamine transferase (SPINDLY family)
MSDPNLPIAPASLELELHRINTTLVPNHQFLEALTELMLLAKHHADDAQLWLLVGHVYTRMAHWTDAVAALRAAIKLNPELHAANRLLALALFSMGQQQQACELIDRLVKTSSESGDWMLRAYIHAHTSRDPMRALQVARDWGKRFADPLTRNAKPLRVADRNPLKRLKIGYVTADFREHAVAFFMRPVLAHHNPEKVDVHVYSNGPSDHITEQMRSLVPHWHDIHALSDEQACDQIRNQGIDVLVDLSGYTHGHRLGIFARRAAPVQVTWIGYMQTLGMRAMDYRFFNKTVDLYQKFYSEKLHKLICPTSYSPPAYAPLCETPPCVTNGYITFVSLNNSAKITDEALEVWAGIFRLLPDAKIIVYVKESSLDSALLQMRPRIEKSGLPLDRVSIIAQQPLDSFMETGFIADVALDTFPVSGGTTTLHSIWMGIPVSTMQGVSGVSNSSESIIKGLGFGGLVAQNKKEYIINAVKFAKNIDYIVAFRKKCRKIIEDSTLMNYKARTEEVENAFSEMWNEFLRKK